MRSIQTHNLVLASNNPGKLRELDALFVDTAFSVRAQSEFAVPPVAETGLSFVENAILKARHAALHTRQPVIADDSGIVVDALGGKPGIYSARYAGVGASDQDNMYKLIAALKGLPDGQRSARFVCLLVYMRYPEDPNPLIAEGLWEGQVTTVPRGDHGFGYDPVFYLPTQRCTSAELAPGVKNRLSHRAQACAGLLRKLTRVS